MQNSHHPWCLFLQILTDTIIKHRIIDRTVRLGHSDKLDKHADGFRCEATSFECRDGNQPGIIPAVHDAFFHQFFNVTLSGYYIGQIKFCKFNLARRHLIFYLPDHPVIQRAVILELQRTTGMCNPFNCIFNRMSKIIHRIDAPFVFCIVMCHMCDPVNHWIPHIDIRRCHINLCTQYLASIRILSVFHILKEFQILINTPVPVWTFLPGFL